MKVSSRQLKGKTYFISINRYEGIFSKYTIKAQVRRRTRFSKKTMTSEITRKLSFFIWKDVIQRYWQTSPSIWNTSHAHIPLQKRIPHVAFRTSTQYALHVSRRAASCIVSIYRRVRRTGSATFLPAPVNPQERGARNQISLTGIGQLSEKQAGGRLTSGGTWAGERS